MTHPPWVFPCIFRFIILWCARGSGFPFLLFSFSQAHDPCQLHPFLHLPAILVWVLDSLGFIEQESLKLSLFPNGTSVLIEVRPTPTVTESSLIPLAQERTHREEWCGLMSNSVHWDEANAQLETQHSDTLLPGSVVLLGPKPDGSLVGELLALAFPGPPQVWDEMPSCHFPAGVTLWALTILTVT